MRSPNRQEAARDRKEANEAAWRESQKPVEQEQVPEVSFLLIVD